VVEAPRVRIIVLNFNGGDTTLRCLEHLSRLSWPADRLELVCVDNASSDGSPARIAERFPEVELRRNPVNGGFPANNLGLRDLDGVDFVGLINNDAFVEPDWLDPLVETLQADISVGAASSKLLLAPRFASITIETAAFDPGPLDSRRLGVMVREVRVDGVDVTAEAHFGEGGWGTETDGAGRRFEWTAGRAELRVPAPDGASVVSLVLEAEATKDVALTTGHGRRTATVGPSSSVVEAPLDEDRLDVVNNVGSVVFVDGHGADRGWLQRDDGQFDEPVDVFAWCGGSVLFRPEYLADVGLFDERFFLYYEDTDLSWRGQARGWRYRTAPRSVARHLHAASSVEGSDLFVFHVERNRLLMLLKNAPARMAVGQLVAHARATASYAARDVVQPVLRGRRPRPTTVRRRVRAMVGVLRLAPAMLRDRRRLRAAQQVPDAELLGRLVRR